MCIKWIQAWLILNSTNKAAAHCMKSQQITYQQIRVTSMKPLISKPILKGRSFKCFTLSTWRTFRGFESDAKLDEIKSLEYEMMFSVTCSFKSFLYNHNVRTNQNFWDILERQMNSLINKFITPWKDYRNK